MTTPVPAGTVVILRDGACGLEVLMLRRASTLAFAAGSWVFPGGRVDPDDWSDPDSTATAEKQPGYLGEQPAARRAAVREAQEEAATSLEPSSLVAMSHWLPPATAPRRFSTWFFAAPMAETGSVTVDGGEITAHTWARPSEILRRRDEGELTVLPPTWVTLWTLAGQPGVASALEAVRRTEPVAYRPQVTKVDGLTTCLYAEDACYDDPASAAEGPRHRLVMDPAGWRYERTFETP